MNLRSLVIEVVAADKGELEQRSLGEFSAPPNRGPEWVVRLAWQVYLNDSTSSTTVTSNLHLIRSQVIPKHIQA